MTGNERLIGFFGHGGFFGPGRMGRPTAANLQAKGLDPMVHDSVNDPVQKLVKEGACKVAGVDRAHFTERKNGI